MDFEFHPAAEDEFLESVVFYESRAKGLGSAFTNEFETAIALICTNPKLRPIECAPDIRRAQMRRFPFGLIYRELSRKIQILAVAHNRRRPRYWLKRR